MAKKKTDKKDDLDPRILEISKTLKQMRINAGYTSYENFAVAKGLKRMQYWRMEKGTNFTMTSLLRILDAHGVTLNDFFSIADSRKK